MKYILGFEARRPGVSNVSITQPYGRRGVEGGGPLRLAHKHIAVPLEQIRRPTA